jgi:hypothetical protein
MVRDCDGGPRWIGPDAGGPFRPVVLNAPVQRVAMLETRTRASTWYPGFGNRLRNVLITRGDPMRRLGLLPAVAAIGVASTVLGLATPAVGVTALGMNAKLAQAGVQALPTGTFSLYNYNSDQCLGITGGADDAAAIQWDCNKSPDQTWHIGQNSGGNSVYHQIINGDGECLGVYATSTTEGAPVVGWQCLGSTHPDQYWAWVESHTNPGYYYLVNLNSSMVVGVLGNSTTEGTAIVQWPDQNTPNNQIWKPATAQPASTGTCRVPPVFFGLHGMAEGPSSTISAVSPELDSFDTDQNAISGAVLIAPVSYTTVYPNKWRSLLTTPSALKEGEDALQADIMAYTKGCSVSQDKIALVGYSMGAWVVNKWIVDHRPEWDMIKAVVLYGDPCYRGGVFDEGLVRLFGFSYGCMPFSDYPYPAARAQVPFQVQAYSLPHDPVSGEDWHGGTPFTDVFKDSQLEAAIGCTDPSTCSHLDYTGSTEIYEGALFVVSRLVG